MKLTMRTSSLWVPEQYIEPIMTAIGATFTSSLGGVYYVPCDSTYPGLALIQLDFNGTQIDIIPEQFFVVDGTRCYLAIYNTSNNVDYDFILGTPFLRYAYPIPVI